MENKSRIIIQGKNTLAESNREFILQYDTLDKQLDYYTKLAIALYDEFEIDGSFTYDGIRKNIATWFENKQGQMERFRKHPYWCEEAKAIIFSQTETRDIDYSYAAYEFGELEEWVYDKLDGNGVDAEGWYHYAIRYALHRMADSGYEHTGLITNEFIDSLRHELSDKTLPETVERSLVVGAKITKFARKCWQNVPMKDGTMFDATALVDDGDARTRKSFDKYYAKFADHLSGLKIKKITLVSLNFLDFMTMSNGNSWSSCHFINSNNIFHEGNDNSYRGEYKAGCLSYALDKPSFLLYTLPASFDGTDYYRCQKMTRMCCQYENGILITGKCYPNNTDTLITRYRQMMQMILAEIEELPNLWTFSKKIRKVTAFTETASGAAHYPDYEMEHQNPTISFCKGASIDLDAALEIGHEGYCLDCGRTLYGSDHKWLQCDAHRTNRRCCKCGKYLKSTDTYYKIGNKYYCEEHVFYCEYHHKYEPLYYKYGEVTIKGVQMTACHDVLDEFKTCQICGSLHHISEMANDICSDCAEVYTKCELCDEYVRNDEAVERNGHMICPKCTDFKLEIEFDVPYKIGDFVLMKDDVTCCTHNCNPRMQENYANRIVRIEEKYSRSIYVSNIDHQDWTWSDNCFVGVIKNGKKCLVGMTWEEANNYIKEISENDEN